MNPPGRMEHELEAQLRSALRREPAPAAFKRKLMDRITAEETHKAAAGVPSARLFPWKRPVSLALAAALIAGVVVPLSVTEYRRMQRQRAIQARNELLTALSLTNTALRHTKKMIRRTTRHSA